MDSPRLSLLWPGRPRGRLRRWDWPLLALAYVLAVVARWGIRDVHPYTAEAAHYQMSRHLWRGVDNLGSLFPDVVPDDFSWFFWQRPLLCLLYAPAAAFGFETYRAAHLLVASAIPVLAAVLLRHLGTAPLPAYAAAATLAVHPVLLPWTVLVLPDATVCAFTLAGLIAAHDGRPILTTVLLLAASWTKEIGVVTAAALFLLALWREADGRRASLYPLRMGKFATGMLAVAVLSFVPLLASLAIDGAVPGFRVGGSLAHDLERLFLLAWIGPLALAGLLVPAVRRLATVAAAWAAFFVLYHLVTGKAIEVWYHVVPATLALVSATATLATLARTNAGTHWARRLAPVAAGLGVAALLVVQVTVPQASAVNQATVTPLTGDGQWSLREAVHAELVRDDDLHAVLAAIPADRREVWTALDMDYSIVMYPMADLAGFVHKDFTMEWDMPEDALRWWADAVEDRADATVLHHADNSLNEALREAYARCSVTVGSYTAIVPDGRCPDQGDELVAAWERRHAQRAAGAEDGADSPA